MVSKIEGQYITTFFFCNKNTKNTKSFTRPTTMKSNFVIKIHLLDSDNNKKKEIFWIVNIINNNVFCIFIVLVCAEIYSGRDKNFKVFCERIFIPFLCNHYING